MISNVNYMGELYELDFFYKVSYLMDNLNKNTWNLSKENQV